MKIARDLMDVVMNIRAQWIKKGFIVELTAAQSLLDVGSGTGHFGALLRSTTRLAVSELDICDFSTTGNSPAIFDGKSIPAKDQSFDLVSLIAVLQYCKEAEQLLSEAARVARSKVLIMQTVASSDPSAALIHRLEEFFEGKLAWHAAKFSGYISGTKCPMNPYSYPTEAGFSKLLSGLFGKWRTLGIKNSIFPGVKHHFIVVEKCDIRS